MTLAFPSPRANAGAGWEQSEIRSHLWICRAISRNLFFSLANFRLSCVMFDVADMISPNLI